MKRRILTLTFTVLCILWLMTSFAGAHARLLETYPTDDTLLAESPAEITMTFSEPVEIGLGAVAVYDHTGRRVDEGKARVDANDPARVLAGLPALPDGLYTVAWRVISADGHPIGGTFGFTVGEGLAGASYYRPEIPDPNGPPPALVLVGYWLAAGGLMLLFGLPLIRRFVLQLPPDGVFLRWLYAALTAALCGTFLYLWGRTAQATGGSLGYAVQPGLLLQMLRTKTGLAMAVRLVMAVAGLVAVPLLVRRGWVFLLGALGLLTVAMGGHAVALSQPFVSVPAAFLHLLAAGAWAGGLVHFSLLPVKGVPLADAVRRFGPVALGSFALLALTGLYPAMLHMPEWAAFKETLYGQAFYRKLLLMAPLLLIGAANFIYTGPRLRDGQGGAVWLRRLAGGEALLIALVLAAATLMTNVPPARVAMPPRELNVGIHSDDNYVILLMKPLEPGYRSLDIMIFPHEPPEVGAESQVYVRATHLEQGLQTEVIPARYLEGRRFRVDNLLLGLAGEWELTVTLIRPNYPEDTITDRFVLRAPK